MEKISYIANAEPSAIENLYLAFKKNPESVDVSWKKFFEGFEFAQTNYAASAELPEEFKKEFCVINLINAYRQRGHLFTKTNPVRERRQYTPNLDIEHFGLEHADLTKTFQAGSEIGIGPAPLQAIIDHLHATYCQSIGIEHVYMRDPLRIAWIRKHVELTNRPLLDEARKKTIYKKLCEASTFEAFLAKKFVGQKRFSIEGGEALIPALDALVFKGAELGITYFVMGMAHRGRLNTLANIFNKKPRDIFSEFEGKEFDFELTFDG
ncbi:MAG: 2-oxoglutarate dehydrogenase E1 component, partial [Flavobacteriia bacterium]|nr:2-oxoglutarate dehydrogenase E1 component [Flavobacteriia bacterium]